MKYDNLNRDYDDLNEPWNEKVWNDKNRTRMLNRFLFDRIKEIKQHTWECVESQKKGDVHYGRFVIEPFIKGEAEIIGKALQGTLKDIKASCISRVTFSENVTDTVEQNRNKTVKGLKEQVSEILENFRCVLIRNFSSYPRLEAFISVCGPKEVRARDIKFRNLPFNSNVILVNPDQFLFTVLEPKLISIELEICIEGHLDREEIRRHGYFSSLKNEKKPMSNSFDIEAKSTPVQQVDFQFEDIPGPVKLQKLVLEIYTNGTLIPLEALSKASINLIRAFWTFTEPETINYSSQFQKFLKEHENFLSSKETSVLLPLPSSVGLPLWIKVQNLIFEIFADTGFKSQVNGISSNYPEENIYPEVEESIYFWKLLVKLEILFYLIRKPSVNGLRKISGKIEEFDWSHSTYFYLKDYNINFVGELFSDIFFHNSQKIINFPSSCKSEIKTMLIEILDCYIRLNEKRQGE